MLTMLKLKVIGGLSDCIYKDEEQEKVAIE